MSLYSSSTLLLIVACGKHIPGTRYLVLLYEELILGELYFGCGGETAPTPIGGWGWVTPIDPHPPTCSGQTTGSWNNDSSRQVEFTNAFDTMVDTRDEADN